MVKMGVLGRSGHVNISDYRGGVLIGTLNWYENTEYRQATERGEHLLGLGAPFAGEATSTATQHPEGRAGPELSASYARTDLQRVGKCVPAALIFSHTDPHEPPVEYFATVNQLAYGEKYVGEPRVQQYLWSAKAKNNALVPVSTLEGSSTLLGETKRSQWRQQAVDDTYNTTTQAVLSSTALQAAAASLNRDSNSSHTRLRSAVEGSSMSIGRKAAGPFVAELNKNYHVMALRK